MAIQHRRGADVDFKAEKMLPGEIAVTIDGTRKVYAAFAPGDVKELASKEEVQKIVDNFENSVGEKINEAVQQVTDEATEQVEGIVAKGEEILNSIPVDYQETVKEVAQLKEDLASTIQSKADAIICEAEGTTIVATDSSDAGFEGLSLYGKSKQGSTTGAQLLDLSNGISRTGDGVTFTNNGDGSYKMSGTAAGSVGNVWFLGGWGIEPADDDSNVIIALGAGTYTVKDCCLYSVTAVYIGTFTITETLKITGVRNPNMSTGKTYNDTIYPMLNAGTEPLPWEKFTGNKPSPNPEYPQEVVSVGDGGSVEGKVCGKNLLKNTASTTTKKGVTSTVNDDGSTTLSGTATEAVSFRVGTAFNFKANVSYILNGCPGGGSEGKYALYLSSYTTSKDYGKGMNVTFAEDTTQDVYIFIWSGTTVSNLTFKPMIRLASIEDDTYEPYKEQTITLQTPNGLPGIPLGTTIPDVIKNSPIHMSGVYWDDKEGQYYIADTKNENGKNVQRIGVIPPTDWLFTNVNSNSTGYRYRTAANDAIKKMYIPCVCTHYLFEKHTSYNFTGDYITTDETAVSGRIFIRTTNPELSTTEKFTEWAVNNNMLVYYILATPIETPLSDEEIAAYKALHTNKPTTTIMNSENVHMKVKYVADTKNHIKQNYIPLSKYTALEERVAAIEELVIS